MKNLGNFLINKIQSAQEKNEGLIKYDNTMNHFKKEFKSWAFCSVKKHFTKCK